MTLPIVDDPNPPEAPPLAMIRAAGRRRVTRRRLTTGGVSSLAALAVVGVFALAFSRTGTRAPIEVQVATPTDDSTTTSLVTTTTSRVGTHSAGRTLTATPPPGWKAPTGPVYANAGDPSDELSLATFTPTETASTSCGDIPVPLMDAVGPTGAFLSVRRLVGPVGDVGPQPPVSAIVPTSTPEQSYADCLAHRPDFLLSVHFFASGGERYVMYAGLGSSAPTEVRKQLEDAASTLVVG